MSIRARTVSMLLRRFVQPKLSVATPDELRAADERRPSGRSARGVSVSEQAHDGVSVTTLRPAGPVGGTILAIHGGTFVSGPSGQQWRWLAWLCRRTATAGALVHFRRAPEHPFPLALEDCASAVNAMAREGALPPGRWTLAGDSTGGGLALALACLLRDAGRPLPNGLLLLSPYVDLVRCGDHDDPVGARDPQLSIAALRRGAASYLAGADPGAARVSPLYGDVAGLPPMLVQCGTHELLAGDSRAVRDAAIAAGVAVRLEEFPAMFHGFALSPWLPEGRRAMITQAEYVRSRTSPPLR